jgi:hypothetical protein
MALIAMLGTSGCGLVGNTSTGGSGGGSGTPGGQPVPSSELMSSSTSVSFGNVTVGTPSVQPVTLTDMGTANVNISAVSAKGSGFSVSGGKNVTLTPNQSVTVSVSFNPTAAGSAQGTLSVSSDSSNSPLDLPLSGTGMAKGPQSSQLTASSTSVSFGNVTVGTSTGLPVILTDDGTANVTISAVSVTGTGFSASGGTNVTLSPNKSVTITVNLNPTGVGAVQGTLSVSSNASNSPLKLPLSGTGVAKAPQTSQLTPNSTSVSFGNVTVGTPTTQTVTLTDVGTANVSISGVTVTGSGFSASGGSNVTLAPNKSVNISVTFNPTAKGGVQGNLSISSNASNSPLKIPLSGTGVSAPSAQQHSVTLNWQASPSQVIGYFVYRGTSANNSSRLNGSASASTTYTDSSVANGQTYLYSVTSVDSSNVESSPSNQISVTIPSQ